MFEFETIKLCITRRGFGIDILLLSHALVTAYIHLAPDSFGFKAWFRGTDEGLLGYERPTAVYLASKEQRKSRRLNTLLSSRCVLETHVMCFNFSWLAYCWDLDALSSPWWSNGWWADNCRWDWSLHIGIQKRISSWRLENSAQRRVSAITERCTDFRGGQG